MPCRTHAPRQGILTLRKELQAFANVRPCRCPTPSLLDASPLKPDVAAGVDFIVLREVRQSLRPRCTAHCSSQNAGGIYYGRRREDDGHYGPSFSLRHGRRRLTSDRSCTAEDVCGYTVPEIERMVHQAVALARSYSPHAAVHSVDKANVMASSRLWRRVVTETMAREYPDIALDHHLVDAVSALMIKNPRALNGVIVTENLFGDILSGQPPP